VNDISIFSIMNLIILTGFLCFPSFINGCDEEIVDGTFSEVESCKPKHIKQALQSQTGCGPRLITVILPWPAGNNSDWSQMTPTHVEVLQCTGACHGLTTCVATSTRQKEVPVMLGKCGISEGKCEKECATVTVEEHTQCGCACQLTPDECQGPSHYLNSDLCRCECKDTEAKRECLDQGRTWTESSCSCGCPLFHSCSSGSVYSNITCQCVVETLDILPDPRTPRSNDEPVVYWEIITIGVLLGIIFILLVVIFGLVSKIQKYKRQLMFASNAMDKTVNSEGKTENIYFNNPQKNITECREHTYSQLYDNSPRSSSTDDSGKNSRQSDESSMPCQECLYQSAESVRQNKRQAFKNAVNGKVQYLPSEEPNNLYSYQPYTSDPNDQCQTYVRATQPLEDAVRLLEQSAPRL